LNRLVTTIFKEEKKQGCFSCGSHNGHHVQIVGPYTVEDVEGFLLLARVCRSTKDPQNQR
jgi:hypothetical protein